MFGARFFAKSKYVSKTNIVANSYIFESNRIISEDNFFAKSFFVDNIDKDYEEKIMKNNKNERQINLEKAI